MDERTYSKSDIREQRRALQQQLAVQQRRLDALAKMDEAAEELEQAEREIEALSRGETQPAEPQRPAEPQAAAQPPAAQPQPAERQPAEPQAAQPQPVEPQPAEPETIGPRALVILTENANTWLTPRDVLARMEKRGWIDTDPDHAIQRLRHSLRRLAQSNANVERDESGATYRYRYVSPAVDGNAMTSAPHANGTAYPALQEGADR